MTNGRSGTGTVGASRRSASGWLSLVMATAVVAVGCSGEETVRPFLGSPEPEEDEETETVRSALLAADVDARLGGNESHTAINPLDTQVIAVSLCFTISLSFDGGRTFNAADQVALQLPPGYGGAGCDDVVTFDAQGRLFVTFLSQIPCTGPSPFCTGGRGGIELFVQQVDARRPGTAVASRLLDAAGNDCTAAAANIAQCPSNVTQAVGRGARNDVSAGNGRSADRQWLAADARPACGTPTPARGTRTCSPFSNNLYVIWTDSSCGNAPPSGMMVASSSDQGANWIGQALLGGTGANRDVRQVGIGIGANGDLYAGYHAQQYAGEPDGTSGQIIVYQSADGTATGLAGNDITLPGRDRGHHAEPAAMRVSGEHLRRHGRRLHLQLRRLPRRRGVRVRRAQHLRARRGLREQSDSGVCALPPPPADERQSDLGLAEPVHRGGSDQSRTTSPCSRGDRSQSGGDGARQHERQLRGLDQRSHGDADRSAPLAVTPGALLCPPPTSCSPPPSPACPGPASRWPTTTIAARTRTPPATTCSTRS